MHRVRASSTSALRVLRQSGGAGSSSSVMGGAPNPAAAALSLAHAACAPISAQAVRCMSAGSKREKPGIPYRRAGGLRLPDADHVIHVSGKERLKSNRVYEAEEARIEEARRRSGEEYTEQERRAAYEEVRKARDERERMSEPKEFAESMGEREPLRPGEQSWREQYLTKVYGVREQPKYKADRAADLADRMARRHPSVYSTANSRNPVLIRARQHVNPSDLPPAFDLFNVPPLSADEIDSKEKAVHASYWNKYAAWKEARPAEYARWLQRLEKREKEQDYHFLQAQIRAAAKRDPEKAKQVEEKQMEELHERAVEELLPEKHREGFDAAVAADPQLQEAVEKLGKEEVLRRWSAYQVFLEAEARSSTDFRRTERKRLAQVQRDAALDAEDPLLMLHDPKLNMTIKQRKRIYNQLLGAKKRTEATPFWTDPDPRFEGPHDWKMADAFVKPPLLPPLHQLRAHSYKSHYDVNSNFSSLHRWLHFERLRQMMVFLREHKKDQTRERIRRPRDMRAHLQSLLDKKPQRWEYIKQTYPFLSDALLNGLAGLHMAPWAQRDQVDFLDALYREVFALAAQLDTHFREHNRTNSRIISFPNAVRGSADEVLRAMTPRDFRRLQAQMRKHRKAAALAAAAHTPKAEVEAEGAAGQAAGEDGAEKEQQRQVEAAAAAESTGAQPQA